MDLDDFLWFQDFWYRVLIQDLCIVETLKYYATFMHDLLIFPYRTCYLVYKIVFVVSLSPLLKTGLVLYLSVTVVLHLGHHYWGTRWGFF